MRLQTNACVDRALYSQETAGNSFDEARAVLMGMYLEKELDTRLEQRLGVHLDRCACCTQFLKDLEKIGEFKAGQEVVTFAVCPSSETLDCYLFDRNKLSSEEGARVEKHLQECPLCKEELGWLNKLEAGKVIDFQPESRKWTQYLSIAAAVFLFVLSSALWWQKAHVAPPEEQLRALAVIKEPDQINYESLIGTSITLPPETQLVYDQAVQLFKQRKFQEASVLFDQVLKANPQHSASLYLLGYSFYKLNEPEKAFTLCDRAESIHPHSMERCMSLVNIALKTGHFDRAVKEITTLYHEAPEHPEIRDLYQRITTLTRGRTLKM